jgi:hypothetical protein
MPHDSGLGIVRFLMEQTSALFHQFRRLRTRFAKRDGIHETFTTNGAAKICRRRLQSSTGHFWKFCRQMAVTVLLPLQ